MTKHHTPLNPNRKGEFVEQDSVIKLPIKGVGGRWGQLPQPVYVAFLIVYTHLVVCVCPIERI